VSLKNNNLFADKGDCMLYLLIYCYLLLGYGDARKIAGITPATGEECSLDDEDPQGNNTEEITDLASKCIRFFTASHTTDNNHFAVFVESGFDREVDATVTEDHTQVDIHVKMPTPPDSLIQKAGFHASNVPLEETNLTFPVYPPKKLSPKHRELILYKPPEHPVTTWFVFKYEFEKEVVEEKLVAHCDELGKLFAQAAKNTNNIDKGQQ
jgi:hypothetical protein